MKIVSVAQMRALEAAAFAAGISEALLQERAGHAVAHEVFKLVKPGERVVVLVGHGNNGRDGAVAAEWLARRGVPIDLVLAPRHNLTVEELARLQTDGATIAALSEVGSTLRGASVAIDALAGIGARGALREPLSALARSAIVRAHGVGDSARLGALGLFDRLDHDARGRQGACFFGQSATERFHELVVDLLAAVLSQQLPHLDDVVFVAPTLIGALLHHVGATRWTAWAANAWRATHAHARGTHARTRRARAHRTGRTWATRAKRTVCARVDTSRRCRKLWFELARLPPTAAAGTTTACAAEAATTWAAAFTA